MQIANDLEEILIMMTILDIDIPEKIQIHNAASSTQKGSSFYDFSCHIVQVSSSNLSYMEAGRISRLNAVGLNTMIAEIINSFCFNRFENAFQEIPEEIPYDPTSYPSCSLLARFFCCFRMPRLLCCPDLTRRSIDKLNAALMDKNLTLATQLYRSGTRWNAYPFHEHFKADYDCSRCVCSNGAGFDLSRPFRIKDGCTFIRQLAKTNKQEALFWIIKQSSHLSYKESWQITSRSRIKLENNLRLSISSGGETVSSAPFWFNKRCDSFAHAYVTALVESLYDPDSTVVERCTLLRAFTMRYPLEKFHESGINLQVVSSSISALKIYETGLYYSGEEPACCAFRIQPRIQVIECKSFLLNLIAEHFKRAVKSYEIAILECLLDNRAEQVSIVDLKDHSQPDSPHFASLYEHDSLTEMWKKYGLRE